ncbi:hypothetical protein [Isoptericola sp. NPDC057653]|uniref:hypothetical protein n=1 Tax=Isoptericola sp. NPDC057653 TaxID=3346195 RepID=UPI00369DC392
MTPGATAAVPLGRTLLAFALLGAGVVNLGLVRGVLPAPQGWLALLAGAAELVAALGVLRGVGPRRLPADALARAAVAALTAGSVAGVLVAFAPGGHFGAAAAAVTALQLAAAAAVGVLTRPRRVVPDGAPTDRGRVRARRPTAALAVLFAGAVAVSTVTSAGLTDTEAGARAVPHSEHHLPDLPGLEGHHHGP